MEILKLGDANYLMLGIGQGVAIDKWNKEESIEVYKHQLFAFVQPDGTNSKQINEDSSFD